MSILYVNGKRMRRSLLASLKWLAAKQELLNRLNVYPVPDGDTGTNMVLTLRAAVESIRDTDHELSDLIRRLSEGALLGARGNSGVILSQIIRGFAAGLEGRRRMEACDIASAFDRAVEQAYAAVATPVEGTILTVLRESTQAAAAVAQNEPDIVRYLESLHDAAMLSLERTPDALPALKEAGVVDSGAMGFVCIIEGILRLIRGEDVETSPEAADAYSIAPAVTAAYSGPRFCTEFVLRCGEEGSGALRDYLQGRGESLAVVEDRGMVRVHIHTDEPGELLAHARTLGEVSHEKIDDMRAQHRHLHMPEAEAEVGLLCTAPGEGFARVFRSLGAGEVVMAGDTSNPSVEEILRAAGRVGAKELIFLPNNKNIVLAGEQAARASSRPMHVLKTLSVVQGVAAAVRFGAEGPVDALLEEMQEAMSAVRTVAVTRASRDSSMNGVAIRAGDFFSVLDGRAVCSGADLEDAAFRAIETAGDGAEIVAIYWGEGASDDSARALSARVSEALDDIEIEIHEGGQPHFPYLISVE